MAIVAAAALLPALLPVTAHAESGGVTGYLRDDDTGGPAVGVLVSACGSPGCVAGSRSDASGRFTLTLPAASGWNVYTEVGACGPDDYARTHRYGVTVTADHVTDHLVLHLTRQKAAIRGHVLDEHGKPVPGVGLVVDNAETGGFGLGSTVSGAEGQFTVSCLAASGVAGAGSYYLTAFPAAGSGYVQLQETGIAVHPGDVVAHDVVLHTGGGWIAGRVTCGGLPCVAAVSILIYCEGCTSTATVTTDATGAFTAGPLQGGQRYDVHAVGPAGWDNGIQYAIPLANSVTSHLNLNLAPSGLLSGRISGRITDAAGASHASCLINAFGSPSPPWSAGWVDGDVTTADDGTYDTGYRLTPGNYRLFLACPGWPAVPLNGGAPVAVPAGSTANASYEFPEAGRPYSGGSVATGAVSPNTLAYFAAGSTEFDGSRTAHEYLSVFNPGPAQTLTALYLPTGGVPIVRTHLLSAGSRTTINVNAEVGPGQDVAAILSAPSGFVAERSMYFGAQNGQAGGTTVMGAEQPSAKSYFAEGYTGPGFAETLTLLNPDPALAADVQVTYYFSPGTPPRTVTHTVSPQSSVAISVNDPSEAGSGPNGMMVSASIPIVAERTTTFQNGALSGTDAGVGAPLPATGLNLAEGHVGDGFDAFLSILNPGVTSASLTITYDGWSGPLQQQSVIVPATSRITLHVNDVLTTATDFAVRIQSTQPVVVERVMYFKIPQRGLTGAHTAFAIPDESVGSEAFFAEGYVSPTFLENLALIDPLDLAATVSLTYVPASGLPVMRTITVPAHSRTTIAVNGDLPPGTEHAISLVSNVAIVAERSMYFAY